MLTVVFFWLFKAIKFVLLMLLMDSDTDNL